ncbi:hypothetical protein CEP51_014343, partial [Fusarium floridanum]
MASPNALPETAPSSETSGATRHHSYEYSPYLFVRIALFFLKADTRSRTVLKSETKKRWTYHMGPKGVIPCRVKPSKL